MGLHTPSFSPQIHAGALKSPPALRPFYPLPVCSPYARRESFGTRFGFRKQMHKFAIEFRENFKRRSLNPLLPSARAGGIVSCASNSDIETNSSLSGNGINGLEAFRGKSGSISFHGLTHQSVEEAKFESAPFKEDTGSLLWVLAPVALISSLMLPQLFLSIVVDEFFRNPLISEAVVSFASEVVFYIGLTTFLVVTNRVQKPYLQFSSKRWGLITGLRGYFLSSLLTTALKVVAPLFAIWATWSVLGFAALVSVIPLLLGILAQYSFQILLAKHRSSCWPLVPIIFEAYRIYQLTKAAHFIEKMLFSMRDLPLSPEVLERNGALFAFLVMFQVLGLVCLWSLLTFLQRLFPSRPVGENY